MADVALSTTIRVATLLVPERDCPKRIGLSWGSAARPAVVLLPPWRSR